MHRFAWDMTYPAPAGVRLRYPISAIYMNTPTVPRGPRVLPGQFTVRLTVDGGVHTKPLRVKMDPRIQTPRVALQQQFDLSMRLYRGMARLTEAVDAAEAGAAEVEPSSSSLMALHRRVASLFNILQGSDAVPTTQAVEAVEDALSELARLLGGSG